MKTITRREVMMTLGALAVALPAFAAADETLKGDRVCAKCFLKKPDAKECQDVLLVASASGAPTEYYLVKNDVWKAIGEACTVKVPSTVTGAVSETDGRKWIAATKIVNN